MAFCWNRDSRSFKKVVDHSHHLFFSHTSLHIAEHWQMRYDLEEKFERNFREKFK